MTKPTRLHHIKYVALAALMSFGADAQSSQELLTTGEHPFAVMCEANPGFIWTAARNLQPGDVLKLSSGESAVVIDNAIEDAKVGEHFTTYNFEVAGWHTYFVAPKGSPPGTPGVWVHNLGNWFCTPQYIASNTVNIDTVSVHSLVSEGSPIRHALKSYLKGKKLVMTQTATNEFLSTISTIAGPLEKARADRLIKRVTIIADNPSSRFAALTVTKKVGVNDIQIFGTADSLGITTMTADAKLIRGLQAQGINPLVYMHNPVPLTGR